MSSTVIDAGAFEELADGQPRRIDALGHRIVVVRIDDDVYAIGDRCTHADVSLAEGEVDPAERTIECWKHGSAFSLETGAPESLPAVRAVPVYTARVDGGRVLVEVR